MATCRNTQTECSNSQIFELQPTSQPNADQASDQPEDSRSRTLKTKLPGIRNEVTPPGVAFDARQKWNEPRINMWKVFSTYFTAFIVGMNDGSYGALIPHLQKYYDLDYTVVSLIFLSPFLGYVFAAIVNNAVHIRFGQRGVAIICASCHLVAYIVIAVHPPYPVLVVFFTFIGFGNGIMDAAWCAWLGNMANANQISGIFQACYSLGATVAPLIASLMIIRGGLGWYAFYYIMIACAAVELITSSSLFWNQTGQVYQQENPRDPNSTTGRTREALRNRVTWIFALFIFCYMGAEVSLGGWIVTFMSKVRFASAFSSSATVTGFWAGMTVGRLGLTFLTDRLGEFRSVVLYLSICVILELFFWLIPSLFVSAIAVSFLGMFLGPMFPTGMVLVAKLMPRDLHVGSIGFATAFGGSGAAVFPFVVGGIAQVKGVKSLQPTVLSLLLVVAGLWFILPRLDKKRDCENLVSQNDVMASV